MGTAAKFPGPSAASALIPTWLDDPEVTPPLQIDKVPPEEPLDKLPKMLPVNSEPRPPLQPPLDPNRFTTARKFFNVAATTGNRDYLERALSSYVRKGLGGSRAATRRMGDSVRAAGRIATFIRDVQQRGVAAVLAGLGMARLIGQTAEAALASLIDVFCPEGGPLDPGIAREAWDEAVLELADLGIADLAGITPEQWETLLAEFITISVQTRVFNDIGPKGSACPLMSVPSTRFRAVFTK